MNIPVTLPAHNKTGNTKEGVKMIQDLTGFVFGDMTVLSFSHKDNRNKPYWICRCVCGTEKPVRTDSLKVGRIRSCGCSKEKEDQTGKRYGLLTVIGFDAVKNGQYYWNVICDCGNVKSVQIGHLKTGNVQSCGCIRLNDITGQRFGRWTVLGFDRREIDKYYWHVMCDCGTQKSILSNSLLRGLSTSCGCHANEVRTKHGMSTSRVYGIWNGIISRCEKGNASPHLYKDRGIKICDNWRNSFENFYADMGDPPSELHQIDRINNNGNYEPGNCRWVLSRDNNRNKRSNHFIEFNGKTQCLMDWCIELGFKFTTLAHRINKLHWPIEKAITTPVRTR